MNSIETTSNDLVTERLRKEWRDGAAAWQRWHEQWHCQSRAATELVVDAARLAPGMTVLDLASGSGEPALTVAQRVAPGGRVVASDLVPEMMAPLAEKARRDGLDVELREASLEALPFRDASFDAVTARFAVVFCSDTARVFSEMRRVLKPGARASMVVWGRREQPLFRVTAGVFARYTEAPKPLPGEPNPFRFAEPGLLEKSLLEAGFRAAQQETFVVPWNFPGTAEETWRARREISAPLFHRLFDALPRALHAKVDREIVAELRKYEVGGEVQMTAELVRAWGER